MRHIALAFTLLFLAISNVYSQPISHQAWQGATIAGGAVIISCAELILPFEKGSLLVEDAATTVRGEMDSSLRSSHPIRLLLQPQTGTTDDLTTISGCNVDGTEVQLAVADANDVITVKHGAGAIQFVDGLDFVLNDTAKILTLVRKNGIWNPSGAGGSGGGSGGNLIMTEGQRIDFSDVVVDDPTEGFFPPVATNCSMAIGFGQQCIDHVNNIIYLGKGDRIEPIGRGGSGEGGGCVGLDNCYDLGDTIDGLSGRANALKLLDENGDGFLIYTGASGPVIECVTDFGSVGEAPCKPTQGKTFNLDPSAFAPDGTLFVHAFNVTLNAERVNTVLNPADDNTASIRVKIAMPDSWDGFNLRIQGFLHTSEATPGGAIRLDWSGYCAVGTSASGTGNYAAETANSVMTFTLDGQPQHRQIKPYTVGNIPLSGCAGTIDRTLWLRALVDATGTTADNLPQQHLFHFKGVYGLSTFTD